MCPLSVPKAEISVPKLGNNIAFGREVLSVKAHKGKALDGLTDGDFDAEPSPAPRLIPRRA